MLGDYHATINGDGRSSFESNKNMDDNKFLALKIYAHIPALCRIRGEFKYSFPLQSLKIIRITSSLVSFSSEAIVCRYDSSVDAPSREPTTSLRSGIRVRTERGAVKAHSDGAWPGEFRAVISLG